MFSMCTTCVLPMESARKSLVKVGGLSTSKNISQTAVGKTTDHPQLFARSFLGNIPTPFLIISSVKLKLSTLSTQLTTATTNSYINI